MIAKSWELLEGGKKMVFHLRDDVQWTDGKKVRAQDFEYSWKRLLNPKTASQYAYILFDIVNAQEYAEGKIKDALETLRVLQTARSHPGYLAFIEAEILEEQEQCPTSATGFSVWPSAGCLPA